MTVSRKVILYLAISLDGYIARKDHNLDWLLKFNTSNEDYGYNEFIKTVDTVIMGRKTYDEVVKMGYEYPHGDKQYFIMTHSEKPVKKNLLFYTGDLIDLVTELKNKPGLNIYVDGGMVVNELMKHHLIDEYIISVVPILLGDGIRLFNDGRQEEYLTLKECKRFESGMAQLHYIKSDFEK